MRNFSGPMTTLGALAMGYMTFGSENVPGGPRTVYAVFHSGIRWGFEMECQAAFFVEMNDLVGAEIVPVEIGADNRE